MAGPAGVFLLAVAPTWGARVAVAVYLVSLITMFWVSSTYHRGSWSVKEFARWQRRDHAAIFLLIAGSYTPYCVLLLDGAWRRWLLVAIWIVAAVGVVVKLYRVDLHVLS
ncbi:MAG TPA: hemolysin III family protein, partial [Actinomycetota bacterium]|nr:hemolysin III family protein [Actinomycetota bacterium]